VIDATAMKILLTGACLHLVSLTALDKHDA